MRTQMRITRKISPFARGLRRQMTDAEMVMWRELRGRRLNGFKFKRQWSLGPYVVDFCCWEARLIVEIDGGQHSPKRDAPRTIWLEAQGYRMRRFWNHEVLDNLDGVLETLAADLSRGSDPHPNPLPLAGEGA